jgi:hypothetical protein
VILQLFSIETFRNSSVGGLYSKSDIEGGTVDKGDNGSDRFSQMQHILNLSKWRSHIVSADGEDHEGRPYIPPGIYSPFRPHQAKILVTESQSQDVRIIIPCSEIIRECFGPHSALLRLVLTGQFLFTYSTELSFFEHKEYHRARCSFREMYCNQDLLLVQNELRKITLRAIAYARTEGHYSLAARLPLQSTSFLLR